ncbi:MAG: FAD-dependent oxidoreductase [Coriobacteriales bacterium]|nr:FAD-dependent oxidoreductase [Coriobacteriales bacterium]
MTDMSRRSFVKAAGAAALAAGTVSSVAVAEEAKEEAFEVAETRDYDLIVVGGGFSGCCAAMEASDTGKKIAVVEKKFALGGNADYTEGIFGLNSQMMADAGIVVEMDIPALVHNELTFTNWRTDGRVWYDVFNHSGEDIDWLADHNIHFDHVDDYLGVSAVPCYHWWEGESGRTMGENAYNFLSAQENVDVMLETEAFQIKMDGNAIAGVYAKDAEGKVLELNAPNVIMATGGFVDNRDLILKLTDTVVSQTLGRGYDGKGHEMMVAAGAKETPASSVNNLSVGTTEEHYFLAIDNITLASCYQSILTLNEDGERFVDENLFNEKFTVVWVNALRQQKATYTFFGQNLINEFQSGSGAFNTYGPGKAGSHLTELTAQLEEMAAKGTGEAFRGDTLEELATAAGMDPEVLTAQIERYNSYCETGVDLEFYCPAENLRPTGDGPYYLVRLGYSPYTTVGGVQVDRRNRVIGTDGEPVPGLFSCGVEGCSLFKETYNYGVSGGQGAYNVWSGRNAAKTALGVAW